MRMWKLVTAGATAGALVLGGGVAYASANTPSGTPSATPTSTQTAQARHPGTNGKHRRPLLRRVVHGTFTVRTKQGYKTVNVQRGTVTSVSGDPVDTVTITSPDQRKHTYTVNGDTRVRLDRQKSDRGHVAKGLRAYVVTSPKAGTSVARLIVLRHPKAH